MDERRMTNEQRERERRRKAAAARKAAARYEDPGVGYQRRRRACRLYTSDAADE